MDEKHVLGGISCWNELKNYDFGLSLQGLSYIGSVFENIFLPRLWPSKGFRLTAFTLSGLSADSALQLHSLMSFWIPILDFSNIGKYPSWQVYLQRLHIKVSYRAFTVAHYSGQELFRVHISGQILSSQYKFDYQLLLQKTEMNKPYLCIALSSSLSRKPWFREKSHTSAKTLKGLIRKAWPTKSHT